MREVRLSGKFERNWRELARASLVDVDDLQTVLYVLQKGEALPAAYHDHPLTDDYQGYREFHLTGDIVIIYHPAPKRVMVLNVGTHAAMFGSRKHKRKGVKRSPASMGEAIDETMTKAARVLKKLWGRGSRS